MKLSKMVKTHAQEMKRAGFTYEIAAFYCILCNAQDSVLLQGDDFHNVMSEIETLENIPELSGTSFEEIALYALEPYAILFTYGALFE